MIAASTYLQPPLDTDIKRGENPLASIKIAVAKITNIIDMRNETPIKIPNIAKRTVFHERIQSSVCILNLLDEGRPSLYSNNAIVGRYPIKDSAPS